MTAKSPSSSSRWTSARASPRSSHCGYAGDECGERLECGSCSLPEQCGAEMPNVCGAPSGSDAPAVDSYTTITKDGAKVLVFTSVRLTWPDGATQSLELALTLADQAGTDVPLASVGASLCDESQFRL